MQLHFYFKIHGFPPDNQIMCPRNTYFTDTETEIKGNLGSIVFIFWFLSVHYQGEDFWEKTPKGNSEVPYCHISTRTARWEPTDWGGSHLVTHFATIVPSVSHSPFAHGYENRDQTVSCQSLETFTHVNTPVCVCIYVWMHTENTLIHI